MAAKLKDKTDFDHHGPKYILIICHLPDPPTFSLPTTFKVTKLRFKKRNVQTGQHHNKHKKMSTVAENKICYVDHLMLMYSTGIQKNGRLTCPLRTTKTTGPEELL